MSRKASLAKISRPRLFGVVPRERLFALLDDNRGRPLIWISGPPGAGKTALVASYLDTRAFPAVWYQIDKSDADPAAFFHHLSEASRSLQGRDEPSLPRFVAEHLADVTAFAHLFFRAFFSQLPEGLVLVLDNYQEAPHESLLHEIVRQAAAEVTSRVSIIGISREEAPRIFVQLAASGAMAGLGWDKLQLTFDEVRAIAANRNVTDEWLLRALHQQSEGWAAGITLMLERLGHFDGTFRQLPTETRESVFNYFASLIFDQGSEEVRGILLSIAFLPRVTPSIAIELSGKADAAFVLEDLFRRRMFTNRNSGAEPVYQFHALFLDFLQVKAQAVLPPNEVASLVFRSACLLESSGDVTAAMDHWIASKNWQQAIRLILREANGLVNSGRRQTLFRWIQAMPKARNESEGWLAYWLGRAQVQVDTTKGITTLIRALELFRKTDDPQGRMECLTALLGGAFVGFHALEAMDPWIDELLTLIERFPDFASEDVELRTWGVLCVALFHVRPWHPLLVPAYRRVEQLLPRCSDPGVALASAMGALVVSGLCGDFECGNRLAAEAETLALKDMANPSEAAWCVAQVGWLRFVEARYQEALESLAIGCRIAEANGLPEVLWQIVMWRFTVEWRAVGWAAANATLAQLETMPMPHSSMAQAMLPLFQARRAIFRNQNEEGVRLASLGQHASMRIGSHLQEVVFCLSSADILLAANSITNAWAILDISRSLIDRAPIYGCFHSAQMLLEARCSQLSGDRAIALSRLRESMVLTGKQNGRYYLRFCDYAMPPMFQLALEEGMETDLVQEIIRSFRLKPPTDASDHWPWGVHVFTLGRFEALINGEKLEFTRKLPRKTLLLLKAIVAHGGRDVSEQTLCDTLWGDEEGDAARNALSITVLRLRKLLGSTDAVIHQGGKVFLNPELCWVDAWKFETRLGGSAVDTEKALAMYEGPFLPEDEGEPWSVAPRERLRGKFIDALSRYGATLESKGEFPQAVQFYLRGIDADPIVESFHQGLMRCYEHLGKRSEAFSVYRRLKQTLSVLLGVPPSDATQRLFQDLLQRQSMDGARDPAGSEDHGATGPKSAVVTKLPARRTH